MANNNLSEVLDKAQKARREQLKWAKKRYHIARELGFNSYEARILQSKCEADIRKLAEQRNAK